jgi:hypothetical protein
MFLGALLFATLIGYRYGLALALACLALFSLITYRPIHSLRVTLTVDEIMMDVLDAFKVEIPFMLSSWSTDFSSKTAVKGDKITAHISTLPVTQSYDVTTGFKANAAAADSLIADVPVTLNQFKHVPVKVTWLTQLASKIPIYREAIRQYGYVLAKSVVDYAITQILAANSTYSETIAPINFNLDSCETLRTDLNTQKASPRRRFGILNSTYAASLQNDDRVKSALFYGQLNGDYGYRVFRNVAGFPNVWEYPDFPAGGNGENLVGFFGDPRAVVIANRRVDFSNAAEMLGVPQVMKFYQVSDPDSGLEMTGVGWQEVGTGDVYVSCALLYGVTVGKNGGAQNAVTDQALLRLKSA